VSIMPGNSGLKVQKYSDRLNRWIVIHIPSGMMAISESLRLRRQAEAAMADLYATGIDWESVRKEDFRDNQEIRDKYGPVYYKWRSLVREGWNADGTEYYGWKSLQDARWRRDTNTPERRYPW